MTYKLFLDDIRELTWVYPGANASEWVVCRNFDDAVNTVLTRGFPSYVSFDHDLGDHDTQTGHDFAQWLVNRDLDKNVMPDDFAYTVHSANPVGAANIKGLLDSYLRFRSK